MCAGAVVQAQLPMLVYGALNAKAGACDTLYRIPNDPRLNHRAQVVGGVLADACGQILTDFFAAKRRRAGISAVVSDFGFGASRLFRISSFEFRISWARLVHVINWRWPRAADVGIGPRARVR